MAYQWWQATLAKENLMSFDDVLAVGKPPVAGEPLIQSRCGHDSRHPLYHCNLEYPVCHCPIRSSRTENNRHLVYRFNGTIQGRLLRLGYSMVLHKSHDDKKETEAVVFHDSAAKIASKERPLEGHSCLMDGKTVCLPPDGPKIVSLSHATIFTRDEETGKYRAVIGEPPSLGGRRLVFLLQKTLAIT